METTLASGFFVPREHSSAGSERLLDKQEVRSSNLRVPTEPETNANHLSKGWFFCVDRPPGVLLIRLFLLPLPLMNPRTHLVELLAPARDLQAAMVAVDYGADAIYIGGAKFGARHAAANTTGQIARAVDYARPYGVRVYATLNTLVYDDELADAESQARALIDVGVDALIVQDMAFARMHLPIELHASTQVSNRTAEGVRFLGESGFARVILERALSIEQIRAICTATTAEVECFVHGAICVGYSGRCFLSQSMSLSQPMSTNGPEPRSGNRGACSQPCRLPYDLTDGRGHVYMAGKHLLSVRDLNLTAHVGELLDAGVRSLKIEGRLKDTNYIKNTVAHYRRVVDQALHARPHLRRASAGESTPDFTPDPTKSFTRGHCAYFLSGKRAGVASFDTPKAVGEYIGRVASVDRDGFRLDLGKQVDRPVASDRLSRAGHPDRLSPLTAGDGLCFLTPRGLVGSSVNAVQGLHVTPNRMERIVQGAEIYRNYDNRFNTRLEHSRTRRTIATRAEVCLSSDGVSLRYIDCEEVVACAERRMKLEPAKNAVANEVALRAQVARSGDTIFTVNGVELRGGAWFVPVSLVAELRREALDALLQARMTRTTRAWQNPAQALASERMPNSAQAPRHPVATSAIVPALLATDPAATPASRYPVDTLGAEDNVTNRLAEAFYRDHGVLKIERGLDLSRSTHGHRVMRSAYCIRREIGACLRQKTELTGNLWLEHGTHAYRLEFDCARCEMSLIDQSKNTKQRCNNN